MRKPLILLLVAMLCLSQVHLTRGNDEIKILIDESRVYALDEEILKLFVEEMISEIKTLAQSLPGMSSSDLDKVLDLMIEMFDSSYSFNNYLEPWGFGVTRSELKKIGNVTVKDTGTLTYPILRNYDVLILASFKESYSSSEIDAIRQFVENGGGLFVLGDINSQSNSISHAFDVVFSSEKAYIADKTAKKYTGDIHQFYISDGVNHSITRGVEQIALNGAIPIQSYENGTPLFKTSKESWLDREGSGFGAKDAVEETGPFTIMVAQDTVGRGRAVFFGGVMSFWNGVMYDTDQQNKELFVNAVKWLSEPGGPYKQLKTMNEQAKLYFSNGKALFFNSHDFKSAKEDFRKAINLYEQSNAIYDNQDAVRGIEEATSYIAKCETGLEADEAFEKAEDLYEEREYEDAITEYGNAQALYEEIDYSERVVECQEMTDESNRWISLREEATAKLQEAEDSLTTAPSTLDPSGYTKSKSLFEEAKSTWEEYGDPDKEAVCAEKILFCEQEIASIEKTRMMIMVVVVIIVIIGITVVVILRRKHSKAEKTPQKAVEPEKKEPTSSEDS